MKNVLYINCDPDPWVKIATKLREKYEFEPVFWNGYSVIDRSDVIVKEAFPNIVFCEDTNFWRGFFPEEIMQRANESCIDVDFLREFASEELQAIKMMDRLDYDLYSLNFQERQRIYRNMVRAWFATFEWLKPELVVASVMPHHIADYVLYQICRFKKIPYFFTDHTAFMGRYVVPDSLYSIGKIFDDYKDNLSKTCEQLLEIIPEDIIERYNKVKSGYLNGAPYYMAKEDQVTKQYEHVWGIASRFFTLLKSDKPHQTLFGKDGMLRHGIINYYRKDRQWVEFSRFSLGRYCLMILEAKHRKKKMVKYYQQFVTLPNYNDKYVLYGLHYQPEATSNPGGDIFVDQRVAIDLLLKNLPSDYKVYVKEHPHQYLYQREGHTCRIKEFYDDLSKNPRIKILDAQEDTFSLIQNSIAVATIMGTIGWESIVYQKPVINFGVSWYESCPGVLRITDEKSASLIMSFIKNYEFDEHSLFAFLAEVGKVTHRAYYFHALFKNELGISEEECVDTLMSSILQYVDEYNKR